MFYVLYIVDATRTKPIGNSHSTGGGQSSSKSLLSFSLYNNVYNSGISPHINHGSRSSERNIVLGWTCEQVAEHIKSIGCVNQAQVFIDQVRSRYILSSCNIAFLNIAFFNGLFVRLHGEYNTSLVLWKSDVNLLSRSFRFVSSDVHIISTDEGPSLRIKNFAIINLCGVSTKLN